VTKTLLSQGHMRYPYMGVRIADVSAVPPAEKAKLGQSLPEKGAFVSAVSEGGPGAKAGIRAGDVITSINGKPVSTASDVVDAVSAQAIASTGAVKGGREGKPADARVTVGELPSPPSEVAVEQTGPAGMAI